MRSIPLAVAALAAFALFPEVAHAQASWSQRFAGVAPVPRSGHAMASDPVSGQVLLFGGADTVGTLLNDTWFWNGVTWAGQSPTSGPPARRNAALAHDGQGFLLFGGQTAAGLTGDTWRYDGTNWTALNPPVAPGARSGHAMARTATGVLLFGGDSGSGPLAETWLWDGASWSQLSPVPAASARVFHAMAYDSARDRVVMFGGDDATGSKLDETWEWDGATWLYLTPANTPGARSHAALVHDPARRRTVLFGGTFAVFPLRYTWEWDGRDWTAPAIFEPLPRSDFGMAFDRVQRVVMFGGLDLPGRILGDTWTYAEPGRAGFTTFGSGCAGSAGVPTLAAPAGLYPWLGSTFRVVLGSLPTTTGWAAGVIGFSNTRWGTVPLPTSLTPLGLSGCTAYLAPSEWVLFYPVANAAAWPIPVPNSPLLVGQEFYLQAVVSDPGANAAGLTVTNAGEGRIGDSLIAVVESFSDEGQLDREQSSGSWSSGSATFGSLGGDGVHGEFTPTLGTFLGTIGSFDTYQFDTDNTVIPGSRTRTGQPITVTDGRYFFTRMVVPANVRLRFSGSSPPLFSVRGELRVLGVIELDGAEVPPFNATSANLGQPGGDGGAFGGRGGQGGDRADGQGPAPRFAGQNGQDVRLLAGHAYTGRAAGTRGAGSPQYPAHGLTNSLIYAQFFCNQAAAGGGGGGSSTAGDNGRVITNTVSGTTQPSGAAVPGGTAFDPFPIPAGAVAADHFLIGGAGGGGGGSHPLFANSFTPTWAAGGGGAGGGGAVALRAGYDLWIGSAALISARGGSGPQDIGPDLARAPAPGGGGSGGAIVLQTGATATVDGTIDVSAGFGGEIDKTPISRDVHIVGGDGAPGFLRFEAPTAPTPRLLPRALPPATAANVGALQDLDPVVGFQSKWYATRVNRAPVYLHYKVEARLNAAPMIFSDDPSVGVLARPGVQPIAVFLQGADLDPVTGQPVPSTIGPWRLFAGGFGAASGEPGLVDDGRNGFRFQILYDRSFGQAATIDEIRVLFR